MQVQDVMSQNAACCAPLTPLPEVAKMMVDRDCGEIPVVDQNRRPVGVITDRDITCRGVVQGRNPSEITAGECMSEPVVTVTPETDLEECCKTMERNQLRRVPVVDEQGRCCGMVSQADIAQKAPTEAAAKVVKEVSRPTPTSSAASSVARG